MDVLQTIDIRFTIFDSKRVRSVKMCFDCSIKSWESVWRIYVIYCHFTDSTNDSIDFLVIFSSKDPKLEFESFQNYMKMMDNK